MTWPDESTYKGEFHEGKMEGHGIRTYANGNIHEGEWFQDHAHGEGKMFKAQDSSYKEGRWEMGKMDNHW